ncbi:formate dehydrogenase accessory sulfurtransferase FdhD [Hydrogenimonas sp.]
MREPTCRLDVVKISEKGAKEVEDELIVETRFDLYLNGERAASVVGTPGDEKALALGYLISEGILKHPDALRRFGASGEGIVRLEMEVSGYDPQALGRLDSEGVMIAGCGKSLSAHLSPETIDAAVVRSDFAVDAARLFGEMEGFLEHCRLYRRTGAVHTARLVCDDGRDFVAEDLAQHNTIDKALGKARLAGADVSRAFLLLSGRLSSEMVAKAVMHGVPIVASRTAATCMGVKIGERFGLTLAGFVRGGRLNLYTHPKRIRP